MDNITIEDYSKKPEQLKQGGKKFNPDWGYYNGQVEYISYQLLPQTTNIFKSLLDY